jgi:hypothetical protein
MIFTRQRMHISIHQFPFRLHWPTECIKVPAGMVPIYRRVAIRRPQRYPISVFRPANKVMIPTGELHSSSRFTGTMCTNQCMFTLEKSRTLIHLRVDAHPLRLQSNSMFRLVIDGKLHLGIFRNSLIKKREYTCIWSLL